MGFTSVRFHTFTLYFHLSENKVKTYKKTDGSKIQILVQYNRWPNEQPKKKKKKKKQERLLVQNKSRVFIVFYIHNQNVLTKILKYEKNDTICTRNKFLHGKNGPKTTKRIEKNDKVEKIVDQAYLVLDSRGSCYFVTILSWHDVLANQI